MKLAELDEYRDLVVTESPLVTGPVNRFTLPPGSIEDLVARVKVNRTLGSRVGTCHQRCTGLDCLSALSIVTYDIDQKYGTSLLSEFHRVSSNTCRKTILRETPASPTSRETALWDPRIRRTRICICAWWSDGDDGIVVRGAKGPPDGGLFLPMRSSFFQPGL